MAIGTAGGGKVHAGMDHRRMPEKLGISGDVDADQPRAHDRRVQCDVGFVGVNLGLVAEPPVPDILRMSILVGTSGWSYPTGAGTWNGLFYPSPRPRGFDELAYYAEHFDTVEVNSTFYRQPDAARSSAWVRRTPATFRFAIKLFQQFTHPDMYLERHHKSDWDVTRGDLDLFKAGVDPVANADKLLALLVQFPSSFHAADETRDYLTWLLGQLHGYQLAVELRHRSWSDEQAETRARLAAANATWVLIDEPKFASSIRQSLHGPTTLLASSLAVTNRPGLRYLRLHGRNAARWWDHDHSDDRYDYLYSATELAPFATAAREASAEGGTVVLYLNNHFSAKAVANASILRHQLDQPLTGAYPRAMVERYPELAGIVTTAGLF
jgi:uncharacterized protein YecE (DUF72 family)